MNHEHGPDWWLWQLNRQVAQYVSDPSAANEARLKSLIADAFVLLDRDRIARRYVRHFPDAS